MIYDEIEIRGDMIRLGQLLKLAAIADSGSEARALLSQNAVTVNGEPEAAAGGRQLHRATGCDRREHREGV